MAAATTPAGAVGRWRRQRLGAVRRIVRDACGGPRGGAAYRYFPLSAPSHNRGSTPDSGRVAGGAVGAPAGELIATVAGSPTPGVQGRSPW
ncbi:hypothetical protein SVIO_040410 [Streptomyces violaceusniger]|uniref:Uncharacterized protein n=1 Tax=Streptomyces violaceusniger TaxID=68280 RepID=A0A4D4L4A9_STRVO|nr:hypothetical protein SVIO_040410 [Streptomyces violaceusniger]